MNDMQKIKDLLSSLCSLSGISGHEMPVTDAVKEAWEKLADEVSVSKLGNVYALKKADDPLAENNRRILFAVHMDAVGMIITDITGEFLRFEQVGGLDPRVLPGQFVKIHGRKGDIPGLIVMPGRNLTKEDYGSDPIPLHELLIDTGYTEDELKQHVRIGDTVSFANEPVWMQGDTLAAHTLDNRASVAALTYALEELQTIRHKWDVYAVGTVQEEETMVGAFTAAYDIRPDIAVAIDVTFAKGPGSKGWNAQELGSGPSLGFGMNIHPALHEMCREVCENNNLPFTFEPSARMSGTDAMGLQITTAGFPCMVISIPLRYMHTPNEVISMKDIKNVGKLLAEFVRSLDEITLDRLKWED